MNIINRYSTLDIDDVSDINLPYLTAKCKNNPILCGIVIAISFFITLMVLNFISYFIFYNFISKGI